MAHPLARWAGVAWDDMAGKKPTSKGEEWWTLKENRNQFLKCLWFWELFSLKETVLVKLAYFVNDPAMISYLC